MATPFFNDTFTTGSTSPITSHTPDSGGSWVAGYGASQPSVYASFGGVAAGGAASSSTLASVSAPSADISLDFTWHIDTTGIANVGVLVRANSDASNAYVPIYVPSTGKFQMLKFTEATGASAVSLGTSAGTYNYANNSDVVGNVSAVGNVITVTASGVQVLQVTDTSYPTNKRFGLWFGQPNNATPASGVFVSSFSATDLASSGSGGGTTPTAPGAPTIGTAAPGNGTVSVPFTAPASNGGSAITGYTADLYRASDNTHLGSATGTTSPISVTSTNGVPVYATVTAQNGTGTSPASAHSNTVTPAAAGSSGSVGVSIAPVPTQPQFKDRVRDTSTSTSASTIALAGAPPTGHQAFSAYAVGTKGIPVFFGDQSGPNWMTCLCTLTTSGTLTVDKIYSSSAAGSAPTFAAGTKDVFVAPLAALGTRKAYIDLADYPVDPYFAVDSTAGIQMAFDDALATGLGVVKGIGHYKIAGALQANGNAQLVIRNTREAHPNRSIRIEGHLPPNFEQQGIHNVEPPTNGLIFESTITGTGYNPAVIGCEQGDTGDEAGWQWNYTNVGLKSLCVRTMASPSGSTPNNMSGINLQYCAQVTEFDMLRIDVSRGLQDMAQPTAGRGFILPQVNNHLLINGGTVYVSGYFDGAFFGEHTHFSNLILVGVVNGVRLPQSYHASHVSMLSMEWYCHGIVMEGNHAVFIGTFDVEHDVAADGGPNFNFVNDFVYTSGSMKATIGQCHIVRGQGIGIDYNAWTVSDSSGSVHYKIISGAGAN